MIEARRRFFRTPFGSALLGGVVVAAFGWIAIAAGWIDADGELDHDRRRRRSPHRGSSTRASGDGQRRQPDLPGATARASPSSSAAARADAGAVARSTRSGEPQGGGTATGSGFVIDTEGHILTNNHVVEGADKIDGQARRLRQRTYDAKVVGTDPATDLALLKVDAPGDRAAPARRSATPRKVEVGDPVVAIGNPFGLDRTVTSGIVSALQRQIQAPNGFSIANVIQTDAAINPGNSGGPLIDADGQVIGINSQIETGGGGSGNVGIGFAIPINTAKREIAAAREQRRRSSTPTSGSAAAASPRNSRRR